MNIQYLALNNFPCNNFHCFTCEIFFLKTSEQKSTTKWICIIFWLLSTNSPSTWYVIHVQAITAPYHSVISPDNCWEFHTQYSSGLEKLEQYNTNPSYHITAVAYKKLCHSLLLHRDTHSANLGCASEILNINVFCQTAG